MTGEAINRAVPQQLHSHHATVMECCAYASIKRVIFDSFWFGFKILSFVKYFADLSKQIWSPNQIPGPFQSFARPGGGGLRGPDAENQG